MIGLYKAELVHRKDLGGGFDDLELATLEWVNWFNGSAYLARSATYRPSSMRPAATVRPFRTRPGFNRLSLRQTRGGSPSLRLLLFRTATMETPHLLTICVRITARSLRGRPASDASREQGGHLQAL